MRIHRLTRAQWLGKKPGKLHDGGGLYVLRSSATAACAYGRLKVKGKSYAWPGYGSVDESTIDEIRELHAANRKRARAGIDPVEHNKAAAEKAKAETAAAAMTVRKAAEAYHALKQHGWRSRKYRAQWLNRLERHVFPKLGDKPIGAVTTADVLAVLDPIWLTKRDVADDVRRQLEEVIQWAIANHHRSDQDNPANWKTHLKYRLPARKKASEVKHHAALPPRETREFWQRLAQDTSLTSQALQFLVLTNPRAGDINGQQYGGDEYVEPMQLRHVDFEHRIWTVPMNKSGGTFPIPLSDAALDILKRRIADGKLQQDDRVFPIGRDDMADLLRRMGHGKDGDRTPATVHGMRGTFRTWGREHKPAFAREDLELCMAHKVEDEVEGSYQHSDAVEKRRDIMDAWGAFVTAPVAQVIALRSA